MPGDMALSMILWEYQVHGWDLAVATGQPWAPAEAGLEASLEFAPMMLTDDYQGEGKPFAPRVPVADDAPALDRLVALSGRARVSRTVRVHDRTRSHARLVRARTSASPAATSSPRGRA